MFTDVGYVFDELFSILTSKSFEHRLSWEDSSLLVRPFTAIPCLIVYFQISKYGNNFLFYGVCISSLKITLTKLIPFTSIPTWIYDKLLPYFVLPSFFTWYYFCLLAIKSEIDKFGKHSVRFYLFYCLASSYCCCLIIISSGICRPTIFLYGSYDLFYIGSCLITNFLLLFKKYLWMNYFSWALSLSFLTAALRLDRRFVRFVKGSLLVIYGREWLR